MKMTGVDLGKSAFFLLMNQDEIPVFEDTVKKETVLMLS
jgi:hypothetical protein